MTPSIRQICGGECRLRVAYSRSGHRKNLNPVPMFARFGEAIRDRTSTLLDPNNLAPVPSFIPFGAPEFQKAWEFPEPFSIRRLSGFL